MTHHAIRVPLRLTGLAVAAFLLAAAPAGVAATTNAPIAQTGGMTATLPLLGTPLTVAVTLDAGGSISGVALDPSTALSKTKSGDDFVKFTNTDGSVKVSVKAMGGHLAIKAKAKQLGDLLGTGSWSSDVFGTGKSTASYVVGKDGSGHPTVTIGTVNTAAGVTWTPAPAPIHLVKPGSSKSGDKAKVNGNHASASGTFAWQGFTKTLTISVNVAKNGTASLAITLSGRDVQKLNGNLASLAGARSWTANTCAGKPVTVKYHVDAATASVVYDGATGGTATEKTISHGFLAWFDKGRTGVFVNLVAQGNGTYNLLVLGRSGDCGGKHHFRFGMDHHSHWQWGPPNKSHNKPKSH